MRPSHRQRDLLTSARRSRLREPPAPVAVIEAQLSPRGEPVIGLSLHITYHKVMSTFSRKVGSGQVTPAIIGVIAMLAEHPGISQARLARLIGLERATIGTTVARAIDAGFVVRTDAHGDARSYALSLSPRGEQMLPNAPAAHRRARESGGRAPDGQRAAVAVGLQKLVYRPEGTPLRRSGRPG